MAAGHDDDYCVPCSFRDTKIQAANWCITCQEGLCKGCRRHHENSKSLQNHTVVAYRNRNELPEIFENISEKCIEHNKQYEVFCTDHQAVCCVKCSLIDHKLCTKLVPLDDITESIKTSVAAVNLEEGLQGLVSKIDTTMTRKVQSKALLLSQMHSIREYFSNFKTQMIESFEQSSNSIEEEMKKANISYDSKTSKILEKLRSRRDKIIQRIGTLAQMKENSSNLKFIFALKELEQFFNYENDELNAIFEGKDFEDIELEFIPRDEIVNYPQQMKNLGKLVPKTTKINIGAKTAGQAAILGEVLDGSNNILIINDIDDVKLKTELEIMFPDSGKNKVTSSAILQNKCMIFADSSDASRLLLFDKHGQFLRQIRTEAPPRDLIVYDQSSIAVALGTAKKVVRMETNSFEDKILQEINVPGESCGIDVHQEQLLVAVKKYGILILDKHGRVIRMIPLACINLRCSKTHIYYLNEKSKTLRCCDFYGNHVWERTLSLYVGDNSKYHSIAVIGNQGNVLVCDVENDNVFIVSHNGKKEQCLLDRDHGLYYASGIHIDQANSRVLLATKWDRNATLYELV